MSNIEADQRRSVGFQVCEGRVSSGNRGGQFMNTISHFSALVTQGRGKNCVIIWDHTHLPRSGQSCLMGTTYSTARYHVECCRLLQVEISGHNGH